MYRHSGSNPQIIKLLRNKVISISENYFSKEETDNRYLKISNLEDSSGASTSSKVYTSSEVDTRFRKSDEIHTGGIGKSSISISPHKSEDWLVLKNGSGKIKGIFNDHGLYATSATGQFGKGIRFGMDVNEDTGERGKVNSNRYESFIYNVITSTIFSNYYNWSSFSGKSKDYASYSFDNFVPSFKVLQDNFYSKVDSDERYLKYSNLIDSTGTPSTQNTYNANAINSLLGVKANSADVEVNFYKKTDPVKNMETYIELDRDKNVIGKKYTFNKGTSTLTTSIKIQPTISPFKIIANTNIKILIESVEIKDLKIYLKLGDSSINRNIMTNNLDGSFNLDEVYLNLEIGNTYTVYILVYSPTPLSFIITDLKVNIPSSKSIDERINSIPTYSMRIFEDIEIPFNAYSSTYSIATTSYKSLPLSISTTTSEIGYLNYDIKEKLPLTIYVEVSTSSSDLLLMFSIGNTDSTSDRARRLVNNLDGTYYIETSYDESDLKVLGTKYILYLLYCTNSTSSITFTISSVKVKYSYVPPASVYALKNEPTNKLIAYEELSTSGDIGKELTTNSVARTWSYTTLTPKYKPGENRANQFITLIASLAISEVENEGEGFEIKNFDFGINVGSTYTSTSGTRFRTMINNGDGTFSLKAIYDDLTSSTVEYNIHLFYRNTSASVKFSITSLSLKIEYYNPSENYLTKTEASENYYNKSTIDSKLNYPVYSLATSTIINNSDLDYTDFSNVTINNLKNEGWTSITVVKNFTPEKDKTYYLYLNFEFTSTQNLNSFYFCGNFGTLRHIYSGSKYKWFLSFDSNKINNNFGLLFYNSSKPITGVNNYIRFDYWNFILSYQDTYYKDFTTVTQLESRIAALEAKIN